MADTGFPKGGRPPPKFASTNLLFCPVFLRSLVMYMFHNIIKYVIFYLKSFFIFLDLLKEKILNKKYFSKVQDIIFLKNLQKISFLVFHSS